MYTQFTRSSVRETRPTLLSEHRPQSLSGANTDANCSNGVWGLRGYPCAAISIWTKVRLACLLYNAEDRLGQEECDKPRREATTSTRDGQVKT